MNQPRSTVLNGAPLAPDLGKLQHERDFTHIKAWMQHWTTLTSEQSKVNFLTMLKQRRDTYDDLQARMVLDTLTHKWLDEGFIP